MKAINLYDQECLTALYKSLDFMMCSGLPCDEVRRAIHEIEKNYQEEEA